MSHDKGPFAQLLMVCGIFLVLVILIPCGNGYCLGYAPLFFIAGAVFSTLGLTSWGWNLFKGFGIARFGSKNIVWAFILTMAILAILSNLYSVYY